MNKIIMGACALLVAGGFASCCDKECQTNQANQTLSEAYGNYVGAVLGSDFNRFEGEDALDKEKFLQGMQVVLGAQTDKETLYGMQVALQMLNEMQQLDKNENIKMDKLTVTNAFRTIFKNDTLSRFDVAAYADKFQDKYHEAQMAAQVAAQQMAEEAAAAEDAAAAATTDNIAAGNDYVAALKADDSSIVTLPSGLSYKVIAAGQGDKPTENSNVTVKYEGRHINGDVFDANDGINFNLQGVVPGFREGLMQIAKGGKATLYIPGNLGYGENGIPGTIEPNEMLVFDVEILDID